MRLLSRKVTGYAGSVYVCSRSQPPDFAGTSRNPAIYQRCPCTDAEGRCVNWPSDYNFCFFFRRECNRDFIGGFDRKLKTNVYVLIGRERSD